MTLTKGTLHVTRRGFVATVGVASATAALPGAAARAAGDHIPWYQTVQRWAQTNTSLKDVAGYDVAFWQRQLRRTGAQVVLANGVAGFACFPSRNPLIMSSQFAPKRDLLGEISTAARADGMYVCARMDSSVVNPRILEAYPDWRTRDASGKPGGAMCINSPYREHHVYPLYAEIVERYRVSAFTDNAGVNGGPLCHCKFCTDKFAKEVGGAVPNAADMDDPRYRVWRRWNTAVTMAAWEQSNAFTRSVGGPDCIYIGLVRKFAPLNREIATRADLLLMDCQSRNDSGTFHEHADDGRFMHSLVGWDKNVAVASSMTHHSHGYFRLTSDPTAEASYYTKAGTAGGFSPWWHHPTGYSEDRRSYEIAPPLFQWHARNERHFGNARPVVTAGLIYSDANAVNFGRDAPPIYQPGLISEVTQVPYRGMSQALTAGRVPYCPIHILDLAKHASELPAIILPNVGGMSDAECAAIRAYVKAGGGLLATGMSSLFDEDGEPRRDFALADVLGASLIGAAPSRRMFDKADAESYLRFASGAPRHAALTGFDQTDLIAYGGTALPVRAAADRAVVASVDPPLGAASPAPAILLGTFGRGRVAFLPVDLDRRYLRDPDPDQSLLLSNLVRWCARDKVPFDIEGPGQVGGYLYRQGRNLVLHLLNASGIDSGDEMTGTIYPVGPIRIRLQAPAAAGKVRLLVGDRTVPTRREKDVLVFEIDRIDDYQVVVVE